jgi:NADPH:quinone reductase-like Zn-dependent oxidoreductase
MPSAYQIHGRTQYSWTSTDALENLRLNKDVPKPTDIPKGHALVRIRAAALNARDMMVVAHDPIYPGPHVDDLVPCCDAAGEISAVGPDSKFKVGDKVVISPVAWMDWQYHVGGEDEGYMNMNAKGAGNVQGLLQEYAVIVRASLPALLIYSSGSM